MKTQFKYYFKQLLLLILIGIIASCSNKKDLIYPIQTTLVINEQKLVDRFLQVPANANDDVKKILANIAKTEKTTPFLANYAAKFGMPAWQYMFGSNKQPTSQQVQSGYTTFGTNSASNSSTGVYFIPLTDSVTKRTKAFIYCRQYNDSSFTYRTYDIDMALASQPTTDTLKQNKDIALSFAAYFERKINGSVKTEAFKSNKFANINIREVSNPNLVTNNAQNSVQVLITECTRWLHLVIEHDLGNGQIEHQIVTSIKIPCGDDGIGGGDMFFPISIITNPPPPPNPDPSLGTGDGTTTNPPNYYGGGYQNGTYTLPNHWSIWNPNYDPSLFPFGSINIQQLATFSPQLQSLIFTLGLNQTQIDWLNNNGDKTNTLFDYLNTNNTTEARGIAIWAVSYFMQHTNINIEIFTNQFLGKSEGYEGAYDSYWDNPNLTFPPQNLPSWNDFNSAFPKDFDPLYNTPEKMYNSIGGTVASIYSGPTTNTCAIRLSKALNYSGVTIPNIPGQTYKGADNKYYFKAAYQINIWMRKTFGTNPATSTTPLNSNHFFYSQTDAGINGINLPNLLAGKKGIYSIYSSNFNWASGHADLLNPNSTCGNNCHFADAPIERLDIWILN